MPKILIVEDDPAIRTLVERFLSKQGYQMQCAADGRTGMTLFEQFNPDLAILDIGLPEGPGGLTLCKNMRERTGVRVVILTSDINLETKRKCFELGANDYLAKPFYVQELHWRIRGILKTTPPDPVKTTRIGGLVIDPYRHEIFLDDQPIVLTSLEFKLLHILALESGYVLSRSDLMKKAYDLKEGEHMGDVRVIDVHIGQIRKKMGNPEWIKTVRSVGYKLEAPSVQEEQSPNFASQAS